MHSDNVYEYYGRQKNDMESSVIPYLVFQVIEDELYVVLITDGLCRLFSEKRSEIRKILEKNIFTTIHPEDAEKLSASWHQFVTEGGSYNIVFKKQIHGQFRTIHAQGNNLLTDTGEKLHVVWCGDITDIVNAEKINTYYDKLTGLPNMSAFGVLAEQERSRLQKSGLVPAFIYFDIRDMKAINEKYGFARGNGVLSGTAFVLKDVFENAAIARFSDDHFVVLTEKRHLEQKIEQVNDQILRNPMGIPVQVCAGIYYDEKGELDVFASCDRARLACKSIKGDYTRKYHVFDREMFTEYRQRRHVLNHFEEALENGYIKLYYQPIIRTVTGKICDMEALARWMDPEKGMLPPAQFIPVLEDNRLIHKLDFYMLRKICENLAQQKSMNMPLVPVSVNLSRSNFEVCDVFDEVLSIVNEYNIAHHLLTVEITESAFIKNQEFLRSQIDRFREAGFNVWMDDFGSEYSSLNTLQEYTFDLIKLDMRFMKNFSLTGKNHFILSDILNMISRLGVSTLAEGVQTKEQLRFLRDAGCDRVQGYLFSKPMPCEYFYNKTKVFGNLEYDDIASTAYYEKVSMTNLEAFAPDDRADGFLGISGKVPIAVIESSPDGYRILKANPAYRAFLEALGHNPDQVHGDFYEWYRKPGDDLAEVFRICSERKELRDMVFRHENNYTIEARIAHIAHDKKHHRRSFLIVIKQLKPFEQMAFRA